MKNYEIDASKFKSRKEVHEVLQSIFSDCEYYGASLDALHDVLTSITDDVTVTVKNISKSRDYVDTYTDRLRAVFCDSAEENPHITLVFTEE